VAKKKRKPLVFSQQQKSEAQKFAKNPERLRSHMAEPPLGGWDSSYVPGYSDARHHNEILKREGKKPVPLPIRLQWMRMANDSHDYRDIIKWKRLGYEPLECAEGGCAKLEEHGYDLPPAGHIDPQDHIRKDDLILGWTSGERAAKNLADEEAYKKAIHDVPAQDTIEGEVEEEEQVYLSHGADAFDQVW